MKRVLVAMSGGVDSSVAAYLLREQGYECIGVTMRLYANETVGIHPRHTCCSLDDVDDARSVAYRLGIEYHVYDFSAAFEEKVIKKFVDCYERGLIPNPCIDCNRYLKFEHLLRRAELLGCDYIATGHYAQVVRGSDGRYGLRKGIDETKDQTYALYNLDQAVLSRVLLPLGSMHKTEVRAIAEAQGFINASKHDSQDICFVPDGDYVHFLERYQNKRYLPGELVDTDGRVRGMHRGAIAYTIGQRRGLGVANSEPLYVVGKDMSSNTVHIGTQDKLFASSLIAEAFNWIDRPFSEPIRCLCKVRYGAKAQPCLVTPVSENQVCITFDQPQRAITPGQAAVIYRDSDVVGGGTIVHVER